MADVMLAMDCVTNPVAAAHGVAEWRALGHDHPAVCPFGVFRASDGFVVIQGMGRGADSTWGRLCAVIGQPELVTDPRTATEAERLRNRELVNSRIAAWVATRTREQVVGPLQAAGGLAGPVHSPREAVTHPFYQSRGSVAVVAQHEPQLPPVTMVTMPFTTSGLIAPPRRPPMLGEHTRSVLEELLGVASEQVDRLYAAGVVVTRREWP